MSATSDVPEASALLVVGSVVAELAALYVIAVAGSNLVPQCPRFSRYTVRVPATLLLQFVALGLGVLIFYVWYVAIL